MGITTALIIFANAATACGAVAPAEPRDAPGMVEAVLDFDSQRFEPSSFTLIGLGRAQRAEPLGAEPETGQVDADAAPTQCKAAPLPIA